MTSTLTEKALLIVQRVLSLHYFLKYSIPQNLGVALKVTTLAMDSMFFFADNLLHLQEVFRVARQCHCRRRVALHKLVIARDDLHQYIDEPHRKDHQQSDHIFWTPYLRSQVSGMYSIPPYFWFPTCNFNYQQINRLIFNTLQYFIFTIL